MDTVNPAVRSKIMKAVGRKHTGPELAVRKALHAAGVRYSLHRDDLPGSPDIVCPKFAAVIFVHGCFWHAHGCQLSKTPSTRSEFWRAKFLQNRRRDERNRRELLESGWRVAIVWQCATDDARLPKTTAALLRWLRSNRKWVVVPKNAEK
jgi:DNA mismatch endonuclease (patch repair protein)